MPSSVHIIPGAPPACSVAFNGNSNSHEVEAQDTATVAASWLRRAIYAYEFAGYGSHVTQPLREALDNVEFSLREVRS